MPKPSFEAGSEAAREAGRKGGLARARNAKLKEDDPEAWAKQLFGSERAALTSALLDAALGRGDFHDLSPEKRLQALTKALEYAIGRPTPRKDDGSPEPPPAAGLTIE